MPEGSETQGWIAALNGLLSYHLESRSTHGHLRLGAVFAPRLTAESCAHGGSRISDHLNSGSTAMSIPAAKYPTRSLYLCDRCLLADLGAQGSSESNWGDGGSTRTYNLAANAIWDLPGNFTPCLNTLNLQLDGTGKVQGNYTLTGHPLNEFCHLLWVDASGHFQLTTRSTTPSSALQASLRNRGRLHSCQRLGLGDPGTADRIPLRDTGRRLEPGGDRQRNHGRLATETAGVGCHLANAHATTAVGNGNSRQ